MYIRADGVEPMAAGGPEAMTDHIHPEGEPTEERRRIPERLGKYRVLEELGRGGMSAVYRCEDTETGVAVAAKVLLPELAAQPAFVKRFRREIETHRNLDHPSIVKILDVGQDGYCQYYIMEYMDGPTVEKQLRLIGKFTVPEALRVTRAVTNALQYAHARGVVHRDIKPANIMASAAGDVKLADFGIAKDIDATRLTITGGIVGTADYMSPEQAEGRRVTAKSDVYSVGVCLYQMLTGRLPFIGKTYLDVIRAHRFNMPESPRTLNPAIPSRVGKLVESMMEKDPQKRPSSAAEVLQRLDLIERGQMELSEEERESAREMVRYALLREVSWKEMALKIAGAAAFVVLVILVISGMRYRYFTTPAYKYSLGMAAFRQGDYDKAKAYFEEVRYFHPKSGEATRADERMKEIRYVEHKKAEPVKLADTTRPKAMSHYESALALIESGKTDEGIVYLRTIAKDFADTDGGKLAAAKLEELGGTANLHKMPPAVDSTATADSTSSH